MSRYSLGFFAEKTDVETGRSTKLPCGWKACIVVSVVLSGGAFFVAICKSYPRSNLDFDYIGIIIAILSLLVTALLGWQVYSVINLKETQNALDKSTNEANIIKRDFNNFKKYVDAETHANNAASLYILKRYIESILNTLKALQLYAEIESYTDKKDDIKRGIHLCVTNWATCLIAGQGKSKYSATPDFIDADDKKLYKIILKMLQDERPILSTTKINDDIKSLYDLMTKINTNGNDNHLDDSDIKIITDISQRNSPAVSDE